MLTYKKILLLVIISTYFSGCVLTETKKDDIQHAIIERDGAVYSLYESELSLEEEQSYVVQERIQRLSEKYVYDRTNKEVDNNIYNFLIVIPIKTKKNLEATFSEAKGKIQFTFEYTTDYKTYKTNDGYYHYKLYINSNGRASFYQLNDIKDLEIYIDYFVGRMADGNTEYTTNKLTIPAEEFEEMLERLGISHERLEFQPDDR